MPASFTRALVIANPVSGQGRGASMGSELAEGLGRRGIPTTLLVTEAAGDAARACRELRHEVDLVVSVGGDGTLREVLTGLGERQASVEHISIGVLPMGTGNALGVDFGLPRDVDRVLDVLLTGKSVEMDVADVNGKLSFLVTGVGLDAAVVKDVADHRKHGRLAKWHYVPAALRTFFKYQPRPLTVELDGEELRGEFVQVLASNLIHYGGVARISPGRVLDDGLFEVFLFRHGGRLRCLLHALRVFLRLLPGGSIEMRRARRIKVSSRVPIPYHIDGDPMGQTPVEIEVTGVRYKLLVP